jgi:hypothetical protein
VAVYRDLEHQVDRGDIFGGVPFVYRHDAEIIVLPGPGIVTSHGCDCEKYERHMAAKKVDPAFLGTYTVQVAPLRSPIQFEADGLIGDIRAGRAPRYFALPEEDPRGEMLVDLFFEQPILVKDLLAADRQASISEEMWRRLCVHCMVLQTRREVADVLRDEVQP